MSDNKGDDQLRIELCYKQQPGDSLRPFGFIAGIERSFRAFPKTYRRYRYANWSQWLLWDWTSRCCCSCQCHTLLSRIRSTCAPKDSLTYLLIYPYLSLGSLASLSRGCWNCTIWYQWLSHHMLAWNCTCDWCKCQNHPLNILDHFYFLKTELSFQTHYRTWGPCLVSAVLRKGALLFDSNRLILYPWMGQIGIS